MVWALWWVAVTLICQSTNHLLFSSYPNPPVSLFFSIPIDLSLSLPHLRSLSGISSVSRPLSQLLFLTPLQGAYCTFQWDWVMNPSECGCTTITTTQPWALRPGLTWASTGPQQFSPSKTRPASLKADYIWFVACGQYLVQNLNSVTILILNLTCGCLLFSFFLTFISLGKLHSEQCSLLHTGPQCCCYCWTWLISA